MSELRKRDLLRIALRVSLLQATFNFERQQGLGWAFSLAPALRRLYPDHALRAQRLAEHTAYFNTQPTLCSIALGAVASFEEQRAAGAPIDSGSMTRVKNVLGSSLAAIGDRMFWFTLRPLCACIGLILAAGGSALGAVVMWTCYNVMHQGMRVAGVGWGYRHGPAVMSGDLRARLERMIRAWSLMGVAAVGATVAVVLVPDGTPRPIMFQIVFVCGLAFGLIAAQRLRPSPTEWALGAGVLSLIVTWPK
jgi:PTS system mannose-specific IID component